MMTLYLRDQHKNTVVDIDIYIDKKNEQNLNGFVEINSSVIIDNYSKLLIEYVKKNDQEEVDILIETFTEISDLRGWLWESYFIEENDPAKLNDVIKEVSLFLKEVGIKYNLAFIVD